MSRYEWEREIPLADAESMMNICMPGVIDKIRYLVRIDESHLAEVYEFMGDNQGLVVAEVELESTDDSFEKPAFLGEEVTGDRRYYNSMLMKTPYNLW